MAQQERTPPSDHVATDVIELLSRKWHPVVLLTLLDRGPLGFNELLEAIPDISGKVLSSAVEDLGEAGLVDRTVVNGSPLRVRYELTTAGHEMESVFDALEEWGTRHLEPSTATVLLADGDPRITGMFEGWLTDRYDVERAHDGDAVRRSMSDATDVLLIERTLPGVDAKSFVERVRDDCRVVLLLGKRPEMDLLEVPCDDVLQKPVVRDTALESVERQLERADESEKQRRRAALEARQSLLESVYPSDALDESTTNVDVARSETTGEPREN